jgi:PLP dependent protein
MKKGTRPGSAFPEGPVSDSEAESLQRIRDRMAAAAERADRDPDDITLIVVTKDVTEDRIRRAVVAGATDLGENRVQEAREKIKSMGGSVRWHMIGHLQKNKVKQAVGFFEMIHSVDSAETAIEIDRQAGLAGVRQAVLVQVNASGESAKHGVSPGRLDELVLKAASLPHLRLEGMMTIPPFSDDPEKSRPYFRWLAEKAATLRQSGLQVRELSMGMSGDFEVAIEEGATLVRIGTAIFGPRSR